MTHPAATLLRQQKTAFRDMKRAESDRAYQDAKATFENLCRQLAADRTWQDQAPTQKGYVKP